MSLGWGTSLVDTMEVLSVDCDLELLEDFFSKRFGVSARTRASPLCSNVADCVGLLLQPWFSGEEVVRQCRVVRGMAMSRGTIERSSRLDTSVTMENFRLRSVSSLPVVYRISEPLSRASSSPSRGLVTLDMCRRATDKLVGCSCLHGFSVKSSVELGLGFEKAVFLFVTSLFVGSQSVGMLGSKLGTRRTGGGNYCMDDVQSVTREPPLFLRSFQTVPHRYDVLRVDGLAGEWAHMVIMEKGRSYTLLQPTCWAGCLCTFRRLLRLQRPLGRFTEEVFSTSGSIRTSLVARPTGMLHAVPRLMVNCFQSFFQGKLEFGFGSLSIWYSSSPNFPTTSPSRLVVASPFCYSRVARQFQL